LPIQGGPTNFGFVDNNTAFQLKVRPGITFHNGETLNAEQVKWNLERNMGRAAYNPKFASAWTTQLQWIGDITVVDPMTVKLQVAKVNVDAAFSLAIPIVPMDFVVKNGDAAIAKQPIGAGPYKFQSWVPDQELRSARNDAFATPREFKGGPRL